MAFSSSSIATKLLIATFYQLQSFSRTNILSVLHNTTVPISNLLQPLTLIYLSRKQHTLISAFSTYLQSLNIVIFIVSSVFSIICTCSTSSTQTYFTIQLRALLFQTKDRHFLIYPSPQSVLCLHVKQRISQTRVSDTSDKRPTSFKNQTTSPILKTNDFLPFIWKPRTIFVHSSISQFDKRLKELMFSTHI